MFFFFQRKIKKVIVDANIHWSCLIAIFDVVSCYSCSPLYSIDFVWPTCMFTFSCTKAAAETVQGTSRHWNKCPTMCLDMIWFALWSQLFLLLLCLFFWKTHQQKQLVFLFVSVRFAFCRTLAMVVWLNICELLKEQRQAFLRRRPKPLPSRLGMLYEWHGPTWLKQLELSWTIYLPFEGKIYPYRNYVLFKSLFKFHSISSIHIIYTHHLM